VRAARHSAVRRDDYDVHTGAFDAQTTLPRACGPAAELSIRPRLLVPRERTNVIMKKLLAFAATLLLLGVFVVAGCGKTPGGPGGNGGPSQPVIGMTGNNFTAHTLTVKVNETVTLDNTVSGGGYHILCFGSGQGGSGPSACDQSGNGPSGFYGSGMTFNTGETKTITFTSAGTYHLICTVHPGMYIDVTVQ
jgi:plastocyanin